MTKRQEQIVHDLRQLLFVSNYPPVVAVNNETLEAAEESVREWLVEHGELPILKCGKYGLFFKGCELVLVEPNK